MGGDRSGRREIRFRNPRWEMVAAWGGVGTVEMQREKLGLGYTVAYCGMTVATSTEVTVSRTGSGTSGLCLVS